MRLYSGEGEDLLVGEFNAPKNARDYNARDHGELFAHQLTNADWIPAPAQFYSTELYRRLLARLYDEFGVRYCEDFTATIALEERPIPYLDRPLVWYEFGVGVSTTGSKDSVRRLYRDHESFFRTMSRLRPKDPVARSALRSFALRKFVAIDTPFYSFFQRRLANQYRRAQGGCTVPNELLLSCLEAKRSCE
jgi:hypothetical protein